MAKIWPVYEGKEPTIGGPWADIPLAEAIAFLELRPDDFVSDPETTPHFGNTDRDLTYAGYKHIVVEVEPNEAKQLHWKPGFYRSRIPPNEAYGRLIQQAIAAELGKANVMGLELKPTADSEGRDALKITVVLAPGAPERLDGEAVLEALVSVNERLHEMRDDRVPIVRYATEAELAEVGGPQS